MLGDLLGQSNHLQEEMQKTLKNTEMVVSREGITITGNAAREVTNISIDDEVFADKEMVEDLLLTTINEFIQKVSEVEAAESQKMLKSIIPPGFGL